MLGVRSWLGGRKTHRRSSEEDNLSSVWCRVVYGHFIHSGPFLNPHEGATSSPRQVLCGTKRSPTWGCRQRASANCSRQITTLVALCLD